MQTARVGGAGRHPDLIAIHNQYIRPTLGQIIGRTKTRDAAANHNDLSREPLARNALRTRWRCQILQQLGLELGRLRHQRCRGNRPHGSTRCGETVRFGHAGTQTGDRCRAESTLTPPHAGPRCLLQRGQRHETRRELAAQSSGRDFLAPANDRIIRN
jgi:hypothetical protein